MIFIEGESKNAEGAIVIRSKLGPATIRAGWEKKVLLPGVEVGLAGWERAHSQGPGTGRESSHGIVYAPIAVNQALQRLGIERRLRELVPKIPPGLELWLTTETYTYRGTDRLKEIIYRLDARRTNARLPTDYRKLFEVSIEVDNATINPRVQVGALPLAFTL